MIYLKRNIIYFIGRLEVGSFGAFALPPLVLPALFWAKQGSFPGETGSFTFDTGLFSIPSRTGPVRIW